MKTRIFSIGLVLLTTFAASQPSFAQQYGQPYQSFIDTLITNKVWEKSLKNNSSNKSQPSGTAKSTSTTPESTPVVRNTAVTPEQVKRAVQFKSTGTRLALDEFVSALNATNEEKAEMRARLIELLNGFDSLAAVRGYGNDVAFALAFNIALNSAVYNETPVPSDVKIVEMRDLLAIGLTRYGLLEKASDRDKQAIYEFSVMTGQITYYCREKARQDKDADEIGRCRNVAAYNLRRLGIEP